MLSFDYLKPPAIVAPAEVKPVEVAEVPRAESPSEARRRKRRETPLAERTPRARSFAKTRIKNQLRPALMAIDPHCHRCRCKLQDKDSSDAKTFARVMLVEQKLACDACVNAIEIEKRAVRHAERLQERVDELLRGN